MKRWLAIRWIVVAIILVLACLVWVTIFYQTPDGILKVYFLDVGQGDAIFIEAPNGNQVLVDSGSGRQVLRGLGQVMPFFDRSIDLVIATHADADHIGGFGPIFQRFEVLGALDNGLSEEADDYRSYDQGAKKEQAERLVARSGQIIKLDDGITLEILWPEYDMTGSESNDASIVARLVYGETEFLLTADAPISTEDHLVQKYGQDLQADVLKLGHHGSKTSSAAYFLAAVQPEYAVISAGKDNRYGHPHQEVLGRLDDLKIPYFNTAIEGTIAFWSDGLAVRCMKGCK